MVITEPLVLPDDILIVPVSTLSSVVQERLALQPGEYAITRPRSRSPSKILSARAAALLERFRSPTRIVDAVAASSRAHPGDARRTLDDSFPVLRDCINARILVSPDSADARPIVSTLERGNRVGRFEVVRSIQVLEDVELYQVRESDGKVAALKLLRPGSPDAAKARITREARVLEHLDGVVSPVLVEQGTFEGDAFLVLSWCTGVSPTTVAAEVRAESMGPHSRLRLLNLCTKVLDAYATLHENSVIHGDVHPNNLLIDDSGQVIILDFGLAYVVNENGGELSPPRGGVAYFLDPEYCAARGAGRQARPPDAASDQYSLGALLYLMCTGDHYVRFVLYELDMLKQIVHDEPLPFTRQGVAPWPEVEAVLGKALSKKPSDRFPSVSEFARALRQIVNQPPDRDTFGTPRAAALPETLEQVLQHVTDQLAPSRKRFTEGLALAPTASITYGAAGIAYALYRMACVRQDATMLAWADAWATKARHEIGHDGAFDNPDIGVTRETVGNVTPYHTASGIHCVLALIAQARGDLTTMKSAIAAFAAASRAPCDSHDLTLGRAGTLIGCSLLFDACPDHAGSEADALRALGNETQAAIWESVDACEQLPDRDRSPTLGIAHGWAGILYATLRWSRSANCEPPSNSMDRLDELAECAEPMGRGVQWPRHIGLGSDLCSVRYPAGWCHGSAGFVYVWIEAQDTFRRHEYHRLAELSAWHAWESAREGTSLCCGLGGRAYALLKWYRHTGDPEWLRRARTLANHAAEQTLVDENDPFSLSLYKGSLGIAVLAADLLQPETASMPFFEEEGWR